MTQKQGDKLLAIGVAFLMGFCLCNAIVSRGRIEGEGLKLCDQGQENVVEKNNIRYVWRENGWTYLAVSSVTFSPDNDSDWRGHDYGADGCILKTKDWNRFEFVTGSTTAIWKYVGLKVVNLDKRGRLCQSQN